MTCARPFVCHPVDVAQADRPELFSKKLAVCTVVYDFRSDDEAESKEEKRQTLLELIDFVNVKKSITEAMYKETIDMVRGHTACHRWSIVVMSAAVPRGPDTRLLRIAAGASRLTERYCGACCVFHRSNRICSGHCRQDSGT